MIHGPFVICLISVDCVKQRVFEKGPLVSPFLCQIFCSFSILVFDFRSWYQEAHSKKRGVELFCRVSIPELSLILYWGDCLYEWILPAASSLV